MNKKLIILLIVANSVMAEIPVGYSVIYEKNFESTTTAGNYLNRDCWYFYDGGSNSTSYSHPELDKRFVIKANPTQSTSKSLYMVKFNGDRDYANQNLNPRTELSYRPSLERSVSKEMYFRIRTWFPQSQRGVFSAEFIQFWLHGASNIPLQVEVRNGAFDARWPGKFITPLTNGAKLENNLERWITWEARAKFTNQGGYWTLYMDGVEVFHYEGALMSQWPSNSGTWHLQHGIYSNNGGTGTMECYFDDLLVAEKTSAVSSSSNAVSSSVNHSSSSVATPTLMIQGENFCSGDAVSENTNSGFSGLGYLNFTNSNGANAMWTLSASSTATGVAQIRFANGGTSERPISIKVNGKLALSGIRFPVTGAWSTWQIKQVSIPLVSGRNELEFISEESEGGPNIDWLGFNVGISDATCAGPVRLKLSLPSLTKNASDVQLDLLGRKVYRK